MSIRVSQFNRCVRYTKRQVKCSFGSGHQDQNGDMALDLINGDVEAGAEEAGVPNALICSEDGGDVDFVNLQKVDMSSAAAQRLEAHNTR